MGDYTKYVDLLATTEGWRIAYPVLDNAGKLALTDIMEGLKNPNWKVRKWCAALMDHHADDSCVETLVSSLTDPYADVRRHALHSIGCQPCKDNALCVDIVALLVQRALEDTSIRVRRSAVHMLGNQSHDKRALQALEYIIENELDQKLINNAIWSLEQHNQRKQKEAGYLT